jgi:hypothetical protein
MSEEHPLKIQHKSKLVELHCKEFSIDLKVQRELNEKKAQEIADDFEPEALGLLIASKRADGHTYLIDGATRVSAARKISYEELMATRLFEGLSIREEAELFLRYNKTRAVQAIDRFKVRVTMEEPAAVNINNVLKAFNLHVDWANNASLGVISAISTLEKVYAGCGVRDEGEYPELLYKVIKTLVDAYGSNGDRMTYSKVMLEGLGIFIASFGSRIDQERLVRVLQETSPRQLAVQTRTLRDAKARGGSLGKNAADTIHQIYNHRNRNKLPDFNEVEPKNNYIPEHDPLYVDPNQYVQPELQDA